jgi:Family of unknown function (DUF5681)
MTEYVGYKHPPKASQFQKGYSGNPAGRPKKPPTMQADLAEALQAPITHGGVRMTVQRALIQRLLDEAIAGEHKDLIATTRLLLAQPPYQDSSEDDPRAVDDAQFVAELELTATSHTEGAGNE